MIKLWNMSFLIASAKDCWLELLRHVDSTLGSSNQGTQALEEKGINVSRREWDKARSAQ